MLLRSAIAFVAGFASVVHPCVLPLVPGYLSAVSAVDADKLGRPGMGRRVALGSIPFVAGFTIVFVALGTLAAAAGSFLAPRRQAEVAGFLLVVCGLAFLGLIPGADRLLAPGLLAGARRRGSSFLLGGAFAVSAAPCIGTVLGSILVLAGSSDTALRGALLLASYSIGLGAAFVLAGVAFMGAMGVFRWLRDHFWLIRGVGGAVLVASGLMLFLHREYLARVALNRLLDLVGLGV